MQKSNTKVKKNRIFNIGSFSDIASDHKDLTSYIESQVTFWTIGVAEAREKPISETSHRAFTADRPTVKSLSRGAKCNRATTKLIALPKAQGSTCVNDIAMENLSTRVLNVQYPFVVYPIMRMDLDFW